MWLFLEKRQAVAAAFRSSPLPALFGRKVEARANPQPLYSAVPSWWYCIAAALALGLGMFACEYYPVQLHWYGVLLAFVVSSLFFIPVSHIGRPTRTTVWTTHHLMLTRIARPQLAWVYATTNTKIQIDIFCRVVAGYIWEGKVLANIWFFNLGYISGIKGLAFAQDLKLGIYCNVSNTNLSRPAFPSFALRSF